MKLLDFLSQAFINFFGITQPDDKTKRRATLFICGLLSLIVLFPAFVLWVVFARTH